MKFRPRDWMLHGGCLALLAAILPPSFAHAQTETLLVQPALPYDFDHGRNVSVTERARPDYDAIGIRAGAFEIFPQLGLATGYSDNIYYSSTSKVDDGFVTVSPAIRAKSDWSRHELELRASTDIQRFFNHSRRNQTPWNVAGKGKLEIGDFNLIPELQIARQFETPFSGETNANNAILSNYLRKYAGLRGEYTSGQAKLTLAFDDTNYAFSDINLPSGGGRIDQSDRDRNLARITGQMQYAFTPNVATYVQGGYTRTVYDRDLLNGDPNRDSKGYRLIGGFNLDLPGFLRGTIGLGYTRREYPSLLYRTVDGFAAQAKIEYFPSELTTFTLGARRMLQDSSIASTSAFFDNRASLRVDHELLRNLLVDAYGEYARQDYLDSSTSLDVYQVGSGATLLSSNWLRFNAKAAYVGRRGHHAFTGADIDEFRAQIGVTFMR